MYYLSDSEGDFLDEDQIENLEKEIRNNPEEGQILTQDWAFNNVFCQNNACKEKLFLENSVYTCKKCGAISEDIVLDNNSLINKTGATEKDRYKNWGQFRDSIFTSLETSISIKKEGPKDSASQKLQKLKFWQNITSESKNNKALLSFNTLLNKIGGTLFLPREIIDEIIEKYEILKKRKYTKGKGNNNLVGALIYLVSKKNNIPTLLSELLTLLSLKKRKITKLYRDIKSILEVDIEEVSSKALISKFVEPLCLENCNYEHIESEYEILKQKLNNKFYKNKCPILFTSVCVFIIVSEIHPWLTLTKYCNDVKAVKLNIKAKLKLYYKELENLKENEKS